MQNNLTIPKGSVFCSKNPMWLGRAINAVQWFWSKDSESTYSHAGIIIDHNHTTLESLWTVKSQNLLKAYKNDKILIAKPQTTSSSINIAVQIMINAYKGKFYPLWRLPLFLFPPSAKINLTKHLTCSELTAHYLNLCGIRHSQFAGTNPDNLADELKHWKEYEIIFEGIL